MIRKIKPIMTTKEIKSLTKNLGTPYPPMKQACAEQSNHDPVLNYSTKVAVKEV